MKPRYEAVRELCVLDSPNSYIWEVKHIKSGAVLASGKDSEAIKAIVDALNAMPEYRQLKRQERKHLR